VRFAELISGVGGLDAFLMRSFGKEPVYFPGTAGRWSALRPGIDSPSEDLAGVAASVATIGAFARELEFDLEASTEVRWTASYPESKRDVFVLHAGGAPIECRVRKADATVWEGKLSDGDALYLPFGHSIEGDAALHLEFELIRPTVVDLLAWASRAAARIEYSREPVPLLDAPSAQADYLERVRKFVSEFFESPQLLEVFRRRMNGRARGGQAASNAPRSAGELGDRDLVVLASPRPLRVLPEQDAFGLHTAGEHLHLPLDALPVVRYLMQNAPVAVGGLRAAFASELDSGELSELLDMLASHGVIHIAREGDAR
jgi:hypothetical protein